MLFISQLILNYLRFYLRGSWRLRWPVGVIGMVAAAKSDIILPISVAVKSCHAKCKHQCGQATGERLHRFIFEIAVALLLSDATYNLHR